MKKEDVLEIKHIASSIVEAEKKLRRAYLSKDVELFNRTKKFIIQSQKKIDEILK